MSGHRGQKAGRGTSGELQAAGPGTSWTNALGGALCTQQDLWPVPQEAGGHVPPPDPSPHSMSQVTSSPRRLASHLPHCGAASSSPLHGGEAEMQGGVRMGPCASLGSFIQPTCIKRTWSRRPQGTRRSPRNPEEQPDQGEATRGGRGAHPKVSQTPPLPASRANWGVRGWPGRGAWESRAPGLDRARRAALPHALRPRTPGSQILDRTPRLRISDPHPRLRTPGPWIPVRAPRLLTADPHPRRAMRRLRLWLLGALWLQGECWGSGSGQAQPGAGWPPGGHSSGRAPRCGQTDLQKGTEKTAPTAFPGLLLETGWDRAGRRTGAPRSSLGLGLIAHPHQEPPGGQGREDGGAVTGAEGW